MRKNRVGNPVPSRCLPGAFPVPSRCLPGGAGGRAMRGSSRRVRGTIPRPWHRPTDPAPAGPCGSSVTKLVLAAPALAALLALSPARAQTPRGTPIAPALAAETFDSAWSVVDRTLWDSVVVDRVWTPARAELRPRAERARTVEELRGVLAAMIARLPYSHFELIPGEGQERLAENAGGEGGDAVIEVRLVGERFLVTRVDSGGPAALAGVRPGWSVEAVGGKTAAERLALLASVPGAREPRGRQLYAWAAITPALR